MARFRQPKRSFFSLVILVLIGVFVGWKLALYSVSDELNGITDEQDVYPLNLSLFWETYEILEDGYVDVLALDEEQQLYGSIKGMVDALDDPFTVFMTPSETNDFRHSLEGEYVGIGAELTIKNGDLVVIAPLKGSPAEEAGLLPADVVYLIDGNLVAEMTLFESITSIRGEEGTTVILTVLREDEKEPVELEIERAQVDVPSVEVTYYGDDEELVHIVISQFNDDTEVEFEEVVQEILLKDIEGVMLDVRYNGGGYLDVAVDILSDFIEGKDKAVITKQRDEANNEIFYTNASSRLADLPVVVLINEGSASASEILAGAIQDYERGILIGETTFGKGSVQVVDVLDDGSSLRYTIAKWHTPLDRSIDDVGIDPDIVVEYTKENRENDEDPQLDAAIEYLQEL
ncbi:S41 family peptidase [Candidatus Peregrinibacteria bacterium]|jgi:carboxyl-terminal processing protease|nr:S41 family peptidase [Candidatus Peregrinibacteria bacterium]MBT7484675.1 S41 family peptidase [Candidatus Peregrinibacteria bacterium]MBT7703624.1 S41 family peptidase [Candidatus Peregrinibacteria bacterium]